MCLPFRDGKVIGDEFQLPGVANLEEGKPHHGMTTGAAYLQSGSVTDGVSPLPDSLDCLWGESRVEAKCSPNHWHVRPPHSLSLCLCLSLPHSLTPWPRQGGPQ